MVVVGGSVWVCTIVFVTNTCVPSGGFDGVLVEKTVTKIVGVTMILLVCVTTLVIVLKIEFEGNGGIG